jgi:hypothetical protein
VTGVTVDLLRNTIDVNGNAVRNQVDTFTATLDSNGKWTGQFATHAPSGAGDEVEVDYTGGGSQVTVGGGSFLPIAAAATGHDVSYPFDRLAGHIGISSDGKTITCGNCGSGWSASVDGSAAPAPSGQTTTFSSPVTDLNAVDVTDTVTSGGTTVNFTDGAPLLSVTEPNATNPVTNLTPAPDCIAYAVTSEIVCEHLVPGSYVVTQTRAGSQIAQQPLTVPAAATLPPPAGNDVSIPSLGAATLQSPQTGDQIVLTLAGRKLTTLTVNAPRVFSGAGLPDLLTGDATTMVGGTCAPAEFLLPSGDICSNGGTIPVPNGLGHAEESLSTPTGAPLIGQGDDGSAGSTRIDMPALAFTTPFDGESIHTPFRVLGLAQYLDPAALVARADSVAPAVGDAAPLASRPSSATVDFSVGIGEPNLLLGNANQSGGIVLPAITPVNAYEARWTLIDGRDDVSATESRFYVDGAATGPAGTAPQGPAAPSCTASTHGLRASIARVEIHAKRGRVTARASAARQITLTFKCSSKVNQARVAVWLQRGSSVVGDGSGVVSGGAARFSVKGAFKTGTYQLIEVIDAAGLATEAAHTLTLR